LPSTVRSYCRLPGIISPSIFDQLKNLFSQTLLSLTEQGLAETDFSFTAPLLCNNSQKISHCLDKAAHTA
jgi:hypothetical protein